MAPFQQRSDEFESILKSLAVERSRSSWNDRLAHWERPASDSEEAQIERAAGMVRDALATDPWFAAEGVEIRPQGSYHNNTNVRRESDMDLCAWHPSIKVDVQDGVSRAQADARFEYTYSDRSVVAMAQELRTKIGTTLAREFGAANVHPGNKAFRVSAIPGSRADADVVPALRFDYVYKLNAGLLGDYLDRVEGVIIHGGDGVKTYNFPEQHHRNGVAKRTRTAYRFKKVVRMLKRMRDELVELNHLPAAWAPSFLVESLVYVVEDEHFLHDEDRYDRVRRILERMWTLLSDAGWTAGSLEINDVKKLFHPAQPWTVEHARGFIAVALKRLES